MSGTTNLGIPYIQASQNQKEVTANAAFDALDKALTETFDANLASANVTLTDAQYRLALAVRAQNATLAGRTVTLPARERLSVLIVDTNCTQPVSFVRGTTTLALAPDEAVLVRTDGTANGLVALIRGAASSVALTDGDKGDITVSSGGTSWAIDTGAVTLAKMANLAPDMLIGRATAGTGVPEAIPLTPAGRALLDDADAAEQRATLGLPSSATVLHNLTAMTDPTAGDDGSDGYSIGSRWFNRVSSQLWACADATPSAAIWHRTSVVALHYISSGSWNPADYPGFKAIDVTLGAAGGGAGGGARVTSGTACSGGGGGAGGTVHRRFVLASDVTGTLTITIGAGGAGGGGATVDGNPGGHGSSGTLSDLSMGGNLLCRAHPGGGGAGAQIGTSAGGGGGSGFGSAGGAATSATGGAAGNAGGMAGSTNTGQLPTAAPYLGGSGGGGGNATGSVGGTGNLSVDGGCGGGGGGGLTAASAANAGGVGRANQVTAGSLLSQGGSSPGGVAGGGAGVAGTARPGGAGTSGSGGGSNTTGVGGAGGSGGPSAGGGGGGSAIGGNGGAGGAGGDGFCRIVVFF